VADLDGGALEIVAPTWDDQKVYVFDLQGQVKAGWPFNSAASVWSTPLVISPSMPPGSFLVGAFGQSCVLFTRQLLIVEIAYENEDDFIRNLACFRAEERIALSIPVPAGLVKGTFTPPAALAANRK